MAKDDDPKKWATEYAEIGTPGYGRGQASRTLAELGSAAAQRLAGALDADTLKPGELVRLVLAADESGALHGLGESRLVAIFDGHKLRLLAMLNDVVARLAARGPAAAGKLLQKVLRERPDPCPGAGRYSSVLEFELKPALRQLLGAWEEAISAADAARREPRSDVEAG